VGAERKLRFGAFTISEGFKPTVAGSDLLGMAIGHLRGVERRIGKTVDELGQPD
jgi:hypothetical protein